MRKSPIALNSNSKPLLICVSSESTPQAIISMIRNAIYDGADGFLIDLEKLESKYRNEQDMKCIFDACQDKPVITMAYRTSMGKETSDREIADLLIKSIDAGASMCDVMGDLFNPSALELSKDNQSIQMQKELIRVIHEKNGKVMMSSHTWTFLDQKQTVSHAQELLKRDPDMIKIAVAAKDEAEEWETFQATHALNTEIAKPYLHVCMGQYGKLHRVIAPIFGSCMILCVQQYTETSHKDQPLLSSTRKVIDGMDWGMNRNTAFGTYHLKHE